MIMRDLVLLTIGLVAASQVPKLLPPMDAGKPAAVVEKVSTHGKAPVSNGSYTLDANRAGHFNGTFTLNGKSVSGLVDTGATFVAMNEKTARQLGFNGNTLDFRYAVNTANGPAQAAHVVLDRIEIGGLRAEDVEAFVLKDEALDGTLIGMSFLKKLKSFSVENGKMVLKQ
nr:TIGR02281 family clan AA aspartic protease [uncultured Gellertiella sp.]